MRRFILFSSHLLQHHDFFALFSLSVLSVFDLKTLPGLCFIYEKSSFSRDLLLYYTVTLCLFGDFPKIPVCPWVILMPSKHPAGGMFLLKRSSACFTGRENNSPHGIIFTSSYSSEKECLL